MDQRPQLACCLFSTDEEIATDVDQFDCQACPVADAMDDLWPQNRDAWQLSRQLLTRFTFDTQSVSLVLDRLTRHLEPEALADLLTRLAIIYDEIYPAAPTTES